jgi:hypothetical protein
MAACRAHAAFFLFRNKFHKMKKLALIFVLSVLPFFSFSQGCMDVSDDDGVTVFGFIQPQYDYNFDTDYNTFSFNRARLGVYGSIPYDFRYYVVAELSPIFTDNPFLLDAFISYNRIMWVQGALGQYKSPFSLELQTPCHKLNTIYRSHVVVDLAGPLRDLGFMVYGGNDTTFFKYQVAIMNGTGMNRFDNNIGKDYVGRVVFQPFKSNFLAFGGSVRFGSSEPATPEVEVDDTRTRYGGELNFNWKGITLQGEYIWGEDIGSYTTGGGCGGPGEVVEGSIERQGWYVTGMYMTKFRLQPVVRYEYYDKDISATDQFQYITTLGINYFFNDWTRLQVNYLLGSDNASEINNSLFIQFQVVF